MLRDPKNDPIGGTFDKIDAINDAYSQLRISGLTVQPAPEDLELALDRLECMAAEWVERNICSNWNFEDQPDPNSATGIKRGFKQAFATNLAIRLIPDFNKDVPSVLFAQAQQSLSNMSARSAMDSIKGIQYPSRQPRGSGGTLRYNRWSRFYKRQSQASDDCKTVSMYIGDVNDYVEHFDSYLDTDNFETIASFAISADPGLAINSSSSTDTDVNYQVKADGDPSGTGGTLQLTIIVTTSAGRVQTRVVYFSLEPRPRNS